MEGTIVVKLQGGLGNQLFQYAYAKRMQLLFPDKQLVMDTSYYLKEHIRSLELQKLSIDEAVIWSKKKRRLFDLLYIVFRAEKSLKDRNGKRLASWPLAEKAGYYFNYSKSDYWTPRKNLKNIHLAGYFQNEEQIRPIREHLQQAVVPKNGLGKRAAGYLEDIRNSDAIGISIRAGQDYIDMGWQVCSREYYLVGLEKILQGQKGRKILVFSDCTNRIREEDWFAGYDIIYIEGCDSVEGLYLLTQCKDFVIANSTFAWWGAYLAENAGKQIIAPAMFIGKDLTCKSGLHLPGAVYLDNKSGDVMLPVEA